MAQSVRAGIDPLAFKRRQLDSEPRPYEATGKGDRYGRRYAELTIREGWRFSNLPRVKLEPPIDWEELCSANRTWQFQLHAWEPLGSILAVYDESRELELLQFASAIAGDWLIQHSEIDDRDQFAWYDMATGIRAVRLAYILDALLRSDAFEPDIAATFIEGLERHREALADDERFAGHSNHGFYQVLGQLAMGRRFGWVRGMTTTLRQARGRLRELLATQFAADGVHLEHSPGYQEDVRTALVGMIEYGLIRDAEARRVRHRVEDALAWFVDPMGELVTFGDTEPHVRPESNTDDHPHLRWVTSGFQDGSPPKSNVQAFDQGGYAVLRAAPPRDRGGMDRASYLAMNCAFHSRTHKHADDLSFVWYERGRRLLIDPGRYGYLGRVDPDSGLGRQGFWYSDPKRIYVESTRAHNAVEIDGRSYARKGVRPYGSALKRAGEQDGIAFAEGQVRHRKSLLHSRLLLQHPGRWLVVLDSIADTAGDKHEFVQRFHFAPDLPVEALGDQLAITVPREAERLYIAPLLSGAMPLDLARGREEPELLGWDSPALRTLVPCWSGGYAVRGVDRHVFATLLAFGDAPPQIEAEANRTNVTGRRAQLRWQLADQTERVEIDRNRALVVRHSVTKTATENNNGTDSEPPLDSE
jgi:Heparinase II/III-like protein/Heparinase II/III N-terminus